MLERMFDNKMTSHKAATVLLIRCWTITEVCQSSHYDVVGPAVSLQDEEDPKAANELALTLQLILCLHQEIYHL